MTHFNPYITLLRHYRGLTRYKIIIIWSVQNLLTTKLFWREMSHACKQQVTTKEWTWTSSLSQQNKIHHSAQNRTLPEIMTPRKPRIISPMTSNQMECYNKIEAQYYGMTVLRLAAKSYYYIIDSSSMIANQKRPETAQTDLLPRINKFIVM